MSHWEGQDDLNKMMEELEHMGKEDLDKMISALHRELIQGYGVWREEDMSYMEDPIDIYRRHRSDRLKRRGRGGPLSWVEAYGDGSPDMWHTETYTTTTWGGEVVREVGGRDVEAARKIFESLDKEFSRMWSRRSYDRLPNAALMQAHRDAVLFANESCPERPNRDNPDWLLFYHHGLKALHPTVERAFRDKEGIPRAPVNNPKSGVEAMRQQMDSVGERMESFGWPTGPQPRKQTPEPKPEPATPLSPRERYEREDERLRSQRDKTRTGLELAVNEMDRAERNQRFFSLGCGIFMTAFGIMAFSVSGVVLTIIFGALAGLFGIMTLGSVGAKDKSAEQKFITARNQARSAAEKYSDFVLNNHPDTYKIEGIDGQG